MSSQKHGDEDNADGDEVEEKVSGDVNLANGNHSSKQAMFQRGVLRTNCIDCLDRTNVAQYAYGLAALGHQLHALGVLDDPKIELDAPLADDLMGFYERMGDTLAHQYGGSAAHNKVHLTTKTNVCFGNFNVRCYLKAFNLFFLFFCASIMSCETKLM